MYVSRDAREQRRVTNETFIRQQEQYRVERENALKDWESQNLYNSPEQQMNRLRQAGLNPNLIYGKGADNTALAISRNSTSLSPGQAHKDNLGEKVVKGLGAVGDTIGQYYQTRNIQAQTDNTYANTALIEKEKLYKDAQTANLANQTATGTFSLGQAQKLNDSVIKKAELENEKIGAEIPHIKAQQTKTEADTLYTLDQNQRQALANPVNIAKTVMEIATHEINNLNTKAQTTKVKAEQDKIAEEIQTMRQLREIAKDEGIIKKAQAKLAEQGIMPGDPMYWRVLAQAAISLSNQEKGKGMGGPTR